MTVGQNRGTWVETTGGQPTRVGPSGRLAFFGLGRFAELALKRTDADLPKTLARDQSTVIDQDSTKGDH